jgi:hypothetical protein
LLPGTTPTFPKLTTEEVVIGTQGIKWPRELESGFDRVELGIVPDLEPLASLIYISNKMVLTATFKLKKTP